MKTIILFGGTGDLARKMIMPSLYKLFSRDKLNDVRIISLGRRYPSKDEYIQSFEEHIRDKSKWDEFLGIVDYKNLNFGEEKDYNNLKEKLDANGPERIFYLATLPKFFQEITEELHKFGLFNKESKIAFEKPFGHDFNSAKELNKSIKKWVSEEKIYRVDHYLHKESVSNISVARFTNIMLEPIWHSKFIDNIQIVMSEDYGVDGRGSFYDANGAIKDAIQNHLLQILALCTMKEPKKFNSEAIRDMKSKLLRSIKIEKCLTGQYQGYKEEDGVDKNSETETLAVLKISIKNSNWRNVPIYILHGKNLQEKKTHVYVQFKNLPCKLFDGVCPLYPNDFIISIYPDEDLAFTINTKQPGESSLVDSKMITHPDCGFGGDVPDAYENLFVALLKGDQSSFIRHDEIENQWKIVDNIKKPKPFIYEKGKIPEEVNDFVKQDGRAWHHI